MKQAIKNLLAEIEDSKADFQENNSLTLFSTWTETIEEIITNGGQRTKVYTNLYLNLPQLNEAEKTLYNSIVPLNEEEKHILLMVQIVSSLATLENKIKTNYHQLTLELIDNIVDFLKKEIDSNK